MTPVSPPVKILFVKTYGHAPNQAFDVPLGVLYLSAYLKKNLKGSVETRLIDLRIQSDKQLALKKALSAFQPDIVGISTLAFEREFLADNVDMIRNHAPGALLIIGGPYATSNYQEVLEENNIDFAVIGEGERVLLNLVKHRISGSDPVSIRGVAFKQNGTVICNDTEPYIENLDTIPVPDYSLIDFRDYWGNRLQFNGILAEEKHASVISSRACPYRCVYCHTMFGKHHRPRSPKHFLGEIKLLYHRYGIREFHIIDDVFNLDRKRLHTILNGIISSGMTLKLAFPNGLRADILKKEDILLLKRAGAYMLTFAIESGSVQMQKTIRKNLDIDTVIKNIRIAKQAGLITRGFFMLGFPGETVDEMKLTIRTACRSGLSMASFFVVVPFKNTELFRMAEAHLASMDESLHYSYQTPVSFYQKATGYNVGKLQKLAYFKFYTPLRLFRLFLTIPRKRYQVGKWVAFAIDLIKV